MVPISAWFDHCCLNITSEERKIKKKKRKQQLLYWVSNLEISMPVTAWESRNFSLMFLLQFCPNAEVFSTSLYRRSNPPIHFKVTASSFKALAHLGSRAKSVCITCLEKTAGFKPNLVSFGPFWKSWKKLLKNRIFVLQLSDWQQPLTQQKQGGQRHAVLTQQVTRATG